MVSKTEKKVDITPDVSLLPKIGFSGYRVSGALAEFIDNSIDARLDGQKTVSIFITLKEDGITVRDNASGMGFKELVNAFKLAYTDNKKKKLGYFGLGMKTAATSLGKMFEIKTTRPGDSEWYKIKYDEDEWLESDSWESIVLTEPKKIKNEHGTIISIGKPKYNFYPNLITNTKNQLSLKFGPFLENKEIKIKLNTIHLNPFPIEIQSTKKPIEIDLGDGKKITGWYAFLKKREGSNYGFNLFRNNRLIESFSKFGFKPHPEIGLLYGHLHLDFVPVTHNKREFIASSFEFKQAEDAIEKFIKDNKIYVTSKNLSKKMSVTHIESRIKKELKLLELALKKIKGVSEIDVSNDLEYETNKKEINSILLSQNGFLPQKIRKGEKLNFKIGGEKFTVVPGFMPLGKQSKWLKYFVEGNKITVLINQDFPLFSMVKDTTIYSFILVAEAISEFITKRKGVNPNALLKIRNMILKRAGEEILEREKEDKRIKQIKKLKKRIKELEEVGKE